MKACGLPRGRALRNKVRSRATAGATQWRLKGVRGRQQACRVLPTHPQRQSRRLEVERRQETAGLCACLQEGPLQRLYKAARSASLRASQERVHRADSRRRPPAALLGEPGRAMEPAATAALACRPATGSARPRRAALPGRRAGSPPIRPRAAAAMRPCRRGTLAILRPNYPPSRCRPPTMLHSKQSPAFLPACHLPAKALFLVYQVPSGHVQRMAAQVREKRLRRARYQEPLQAPALAAAGVGAPASPMFGWITEPDGSRRICPRCEGRGFIRSAAVRTAARGPCTSLWA